MFACSKGDGADQPPKIYSLSGLFRHTALAESVYVSV